MIRRKGANDVDEVHLVDNTEADNNGGTCSASRIGEETHVIPPRFTKVKRRLIKKVVSPKGKLIYWWTTVSCLGVVSFLFVLVPLLIDRARGNKDCSNFIGNDHELPYFYQKETGQLEICRQQQLILEGRLGVDRQYISESRINVFALSMGSSLAITNNESNCLQVELQGLSSKEMPLQDCYKLGESHWYGTYEQFMQNWPINVTVFDSSEPIPFLPHDYLSDRFSPRNAFGPILHPLWLNTDGVGILVDEGVPLHVSMNRSHLCLISQPFELNCSPEASENSTLRYSVCLFDTIAETARYFLDQIPHPASTPSPILFQQPIWSTWAELRTNLSTSKISEFCSNIIGNHFNASQLEIDDGYSRHYGELEFDSSVINTSSLFTSDCEQFDITAWVHPFINYDANNFEHSLKMSMFLPGVSQIEGNSVSLVKWWQGYGAVINFKNSTVANSYAELLLEFKRIGLTSFKFDAGEYTYLPKCVFIDGLNHPGEFTKAYVEFVGSQSYSSRAEVRVGYFTQTQPILVRLLDRDSKWGSDNGLQSVLNAVLSIGLGGYLFVLPDMIGGNGDATQELFIRWAQLNAFLPVMQFSIAPWRYDSAAVNHVRDLIKLHRDLQFDVIATKSLKSGYPMILPLWWNAIDSNDERTWTIADQFFIGGEYMVAPMLTMGQENREVYFPLGFNYSVVNSSISAVSVCPENVCFGGSTVSFNVALYEVLYFQIL